MNRAAIGRIWTILWGSKAGLWGHILAKSRPLGVPKTARKIPNTILKNPLKNKDFLFCLGHFCLFGTPTPRLRGAGPRRGRRPTGRPPAWPLPSRTSPFSRAPECNCTEEESFWIFWGKFWEKMEEFQTFWKIFGTIFWIFWPPRVPGWPETDSPRKMMASSGVETEIRALGTRFVAIFRFAGVKIIRH